MSGASWQWKVEVDLPGAGSARSSRLLQPGLAGVFRDHGNPARGGPGLHFRRHPPALPGWPLSTIPPRAASFPQPIRSARSIAIRWPADQAIQVQVVGVVQDARYRGLREAPPPTIYLPFQQNPQPFRATPIYELRFAGPLADLTARVKETVRAADPHIGLDLRLLTTQIEDSLLQDRLLARLASFFGLLALVLASIGLYGVVAYAAARRRSEIGIRMALGATRGGVIWLVLRENAALLGAGIPLGLAAHARRRAPGPHLTLRPNPDRSRDDRRSHRRVVAGGCRGRLHPRPARRAHRPAVRSTRRVTLVKGGTDDRPWSSVNRPQAGESESVAVMPAATRILFSFCWEVHSSLG